MNLIKNKFEFRKFKPQDFQAYCSWFDDIQLKKALGYVDEEWLDFILDNEDGIELAVLKENELVCVIGLSFPSEKEPSYAITNIALKPDLKNKGIGSEILAMLLNDYALKENEFWVSYVEKENKNGQRFFEKNGWIKISTEEMIKYVFS